MLRWCPSQTRNAARLRFQMISYRKVGWNVVKSAYCEGRFSGSIFSPQGRLVGLPNSSWLNQLPTRPIDCATSSAGTPAASMNAGTSSPRRFTRHSPTLTPSALPPPPPDQHAERDPAPDPQAALPHGERAPPGVRDLVPARDVVVQPAADQ